MHHKVGLLKTNTDRDAQNDYYNFTITYTDETENEIQSVQLKSDIIIVTGRKVDDADIFLPPASLFPGVKIKIVNGTYNASLDPEKTPITISVVHDNLEPAVEDNELNYVNSVGSAIPFTASNGTTSIGYFSNLSFDAYNVVELISMPNCYGIGLWEDYYLWGVVSMQNEAYSKDETYTKAQIDALISQV